MKRWPLLVGEIFVDVTITPSGVENKLRLGGIAHAARGFWALNQPFAVAAVLPSYLESSAQTYLAAFGCKKFTKLGTVVGAPNTMLIFDPTEVDDQEYDDLLREEKQVQITQGLKENDFSEFEDALIFPGTYDLSTICKLLPVNIRLHIDAAYDVKDFKDLFRLDRKISTIFTSTSSKLFKACDSGSFDQLVSNFSDTHPEALILKENRGGSRLRIFQTGENEEIPAQLGITVNSVGVGDVFDAAFLAYREAGLVEAAWRGEPPTPVQPTLRRQNQMSFIVMLKETKPFHSKNCGFWAVRPCLGNCGRNIKSI